MIDQIANLKDAGPAITTLILIWFLAKQTMQPCRFPFRMRLFTFVLSLLAMVLVCLAATKVV